MARKPNPYAVCRAQEKRSKRTWSQKKYERCVRKVKAKR